MYTINTNIQKGSNFTNFNRNITDEPLTSPIFTLSMFPTYTLKNKSVNQHLKGPRSDSVFIVLHLPYYPAGANSLKC